MSAVSFPVTRPVGRALLIGGPASRRDPQDVLERMGFSVATADDPYLGALELCRHTLAYNCLVLSLTSLYREELSVITTVKRRFPHVEVWLTQIDGRQAALADAMRAGADGLLGEDGLHRLAGSQPAPIDAPAPRSILPAPAAHRTPDATDDDPYLEASDSDAPSDESVLTADELRALLQEQPSFPPAGGG